MQWVHDAISDLGMAMGLPGLAVNQENLVCLNLEGVGEVYIEPGQEEVLISLTLRPADHAANAHLRLLEQADIREGGAFSGWPLHVAAREDGILILALKPEAGEVDLPFLEQALDYLTRMAAAIS